MCIQSISLQDHNTVDDVFLRIILTFYPKFFLDRNKIS